MGCFVVLFALISPRLALFALWLFSDLLSRAFDSWFVPFLGFFLLPWTTLAYAVMWSSSDRVNGFEWFIVILAFVFDLGSYAEPQARTQRGPSAAAPAAPRASARGRSGRRAGRGSWRRRRRAAR